MMASPVRRRREQRSWLQWLAILGGTALVGAVSLILMRGAFRVGEDMIASVEDTRPLGRKLRPDEVRARTAEHVEAPVVDTSTHSTPSAGAFESTGDAKITISGRIEYPADVPADESVEVELRAPVDDGELVVRKGVLASGEFTLEAPRTEAAAELSVRARYLFLRPRIAIASLARSTSGLVLEPTLGACIHGRIAGPVDAEAASKLESPLSNLGLHSYVAGSGAEWSYTEGELQPDLTFTLAALDPALEHEFELFDRWIAAPAERRFTLRAGELREVVLRRTSEVGVRGIVLDGDGRRLEGVECRVHRAGVADTSSPALDSSTTTDDGRFTFSIDAGMDLVLVAAKPCFLDQRVELPRLAERGELTLRLRRAPPLIGRVVWPDGTPAHDACVIADDEHDRRRPANLALTDEDGRFELDKLSNGPFTLSASASPEADDEMDESASTQVARARVGTVALTHVEHTTQELTLVLSADVAVRGRVLDEHDAPWKRARVSARPVIAGEAIDDTAREIASSFQSEDGSFALRGLHAGEWELHAAFAGMRSDAQRVTLTRADAEVVLRLERRTYVSGVVVDAPGAVVRAAQVRLWERNANGVPREARTDEQGRFGFERVTPGPIELDAWIVGDERGHGARQSEIVRLEAPETSSIEAVELRLPATGTIRGSVTSSSGAADRRVTVVWEPLDGAANASPSPATAWRERYDHLPSSAFSDTDGNFASERLAAGRYLVWAWTRNPQNQFQTSVRHSVEVRADKATRLELELHDAVELRVTTSAMRATVEAFDDHGCPMDRTGMRTGKDRAPARWFLAPGEYRVVATAEEGRVAERTVVIDADRTEPLDVEISFAR